MSRHSDAVRLRDMLDHAREAIGLVTGRTRDDLKATRLLQLGLVRLIEIIGEAAAHVSSEGRLKCPAVPWDDVVSMRNKLIHGYASIDLDILWNTVTDDLPRLTVELEKAIPPESDTR